MIRTISKFIIIPAIAIIFVLGLVFGEGLSGHFHKYTFPGPLSDSQGAEPMGGFSSHAEFEQECGHCHAPLHCVTDTQCQDCHISRHARYRTHSWKLTPLGPAVGSVQDHTARSGAARGSRPLS